MEPPTDPKPDRGGSRHTTTTEDATASSRKKPEEPSAVPRTLAIKSQPKQQQSVSAPDASDDADSSIDGSEKTDVDLSMENGGGGAFTRKQSFGDLSKKSLGDVSGPLEPDAEADHMLSMLQKMSVQQGEAPRAPTVGIRSPYRSFVQPSTASQIVVEAPTRDSMHQKTDTSTNPESKMGQEEAQHALDGLAAQMEQLGIDPNDVGLDTLYEVEKCKFNDEEGQEQTQKRPPVSRSGSIRGRSSDRSCSTDTSSNPGNGQWVTNSNYSTVGESHRSSITDNVGMDIDKPQGLPLPTMTTNAPKNSMPAPALQQSDRLKSTRSLTINKALYL